MHTFSDFSYYLIADFESIGWFYLKFVLQKYQKFLLFQEKRQTEKTSKAWNQVITLSSLFSSGAFLL